MDAGERAVGVGARERGLDLARHQLRRGMADEVAHVGAGVRRRVERLVVADRRPTGRRSRCARCCRSPRGWTGPASEISRISAAASRSGTWCIWMFCRVVMWPLFSGTQRSITSANVSICSGVMPPNGQLDADHLDVGLALAVDALLQAEADELVLGRVAGEVLLRLVVEIVELALDDRDEVPGNVFADLGVLERTRLGAHAPKLANPYPNLGIYPNWGVRSTASRRAATTQGLSLGLLGRRRRRGVAQELLDRRHDGGGLLGRGARAAQLQVGTAIHAGGPLTPLIDFWPRRRW